MNLKEKINFDKYFKVLTMLFFLLLIFYQRVNPVVFVSLLKVLSTGVGLIITLSVFVREYLQKPGNED